MTTPFPLTPGQALAVAAMIDTHPNQLPHWAGWVKALRTWAAAEFEASEAVEEHATPTWEQPPVEHVTPGCACPSCRAADAPSEPGPELEVLDDAPSEPGPELEVLDDAPRSVGGSMSGVIVEHADGRGASSYGMPVVDLVAALRASVEAAKARRAAGETR